MTSSDKSVKRRDVLLKAVGAVATAGAAGYVFRNPLATAAIKMLDNEVLPTTHVAHSDPNACIVTAVTVDGPYYLDDLLVRRDVRENRPGRDLVLQSKVVDAATCKPLEGVAVDIWSCDADGYYSGYSEQRPENIPFGILAQGTSDGHVPAQSPGRALRGRQLTDANGNAEFLTIFPGWYAPTAVHIHMKLRLPNNKTAVTHIYWPDDLTARVHSTEPYSKRGVSPFLNTDDVGIRMGLLGAGIPAIEESADKLVAKMTFGVIVA